MFLRAGLVFFVGFLSLWLRLRPPSACGADAAHQSGGSPRVLQFLADMRAWQRERGAPKHTQVKHSLRPTTPWRAGCFCRATLARSKARRRIAELCCEPVSRLLPDLCLICCFGFDSPNRGKVFNKLSACLICLSPSSSAAQLFELSWD